MRARSRSVNFPQLMARRPLRQRVCEAEKELSSVASLLQCLASAGTSMRLSLEQKIGPVTVAQLETC